MKVCTLQHMDTAGASVPVVRLFLRLLEQDCYEEDELALSWWGWPWWLILGLLRCKLSSIASTTMKRKAASQPGRSPDRYPGQTASQAANQARPLASQISRQAGNQAAGQPGRWPARPLARLLARPLARPPARPLARPLASQAASQSGR